MRKKLDDYIKELQQAIKEKKNIPLDNILIWIKFYQHERLVHLIVTFLTAIATILFLFGFLFFNNIAILILFIITAILFVFYIIHYYNLENGVQKLYNLYFEIKEKEH